MGILQRFWRWFDDRTGAHDMVAPALEHPVPPETASKKTGWLYVFGGATLAAFMVQVVTGAILATKYIPSTAHAYDSLLFITNEVPFGRLLRGMHFFGASAMVILIGLHTVRVFLMGAFKFPREMNWLSGVVLLVLTLLMAYTGQLLRWDQNGVWSVVVAAQFAGRVPLVGGELARFILAGETVGGTTLSRFFAFHVFIMPLLIFGFVGVHLYLVLHHGISELPRKGDPVDPRTYRERYKSLLERRGRPYWPDAAFQEVAVGIALIVVIVALAFVFGPRGPDAPPDPVVLEADPRPDWYFAWYYALLYYKPQAIEDLVMVYAPALFILLLAALPFLAPRGERSPFRRPWAVAAVGAAVLTITVLTVAGMRAHWVPAVETEPLPAEVVGATAGPVYEGSRLFYDKGCQYCHVVAGRGGTFGPDLTEVARRLPAKEITMRIVAGIGYMPAYRDELTPQELEAIVAFLQALPEIDASAAGPAGATGDRGVRR